MPTLALTHVLPALAGLGRWFAQLKQDAARYEFSHRWEVDGSIDEVAGMLFDSTSMPQWWQPFRDVELLAQGNQHGLGRLVRSRVRGFLPYRLELDFRVVKVEYPHYFEVEVSGDFCGRGSGRLRTENGRTVVELTLDVTLESWPLKIASLFARSLLEAHHHWTMTQGYSGLNRELARRRLATA